jgi:integrase
VHAALAELGYVRGVPVGDRAAHLRRSGFGTWLFHPAVTGSYAERSGAAHKPCLILGEPWPGISVRGRGAAARTDVCWVPIEPHLSPHGLRHTFKTPLDELGIPSRYKDELMGHLDGSVRARYSHITQAKRERLIDGLTAEVASLIVV